MNHPAVHLEDARPLIPAFSPEGDKETAAPAMLHPAPERLPSEIAAKTEAGWRATLNAYRALQAQSPDISIPAAAALLAVNQTTLWRIVKVYAPRDAKPHFHKCGKEPAILPTADELACVKEIYLKLDESEARGRGLGSSKISAYRLAAKSDDPRIGDTFRQVVLQRKRKTVPPSWMTRLDTPASVIAASRDARTTMAHYVNTPRGRTYVDESGMEIPLRAGTIFEADDGTLNFYAWIPWPFGGDKCSDKFGVRLGRWQLLAVVDARWEFCPAFDIVARNFSSYRGEDSAALIGRTMLEVAQPELWRLERGSWESKAVRGALDLCQQRVQNAWHSKQKSAVERFFDRLWTPASLIPGHVGRDRGRAKAMTDLALACSDGRQDPRTHFISLEDATRRVGACVEFVNSEPIESKSGWGRWIPQERFEAQIREHAPARLDESYRTFFAREQRVWTVRGCTVGGSVDGPCVKFPIYFQCEALWEFEGCKVKAYFDPYTEQVMGTLVLQDEWRGCKAGTIIARDVPALELPPQFVLATDGWEGGEVQAKQLAVRKAIAKAVRTEMWNYRGQRRTETRDGLGNLAVRATAAPADASMPAPGSRSTIPAAVPPRSGRAPAMFTPPTADEFARKRERLAASAARSLELAETQAP